MDNLLLELAALGVDVLLVGVFYKLYRSRARNAQTVKDAPVLEIDNQLSQQIKQSGNVIPYAVISGMVKASSTPIRSQYLPHISGVLREKITKERKVRWSAMLRLWSTVEDDIQRSYNSVPFVLTKSKGWLSSASVQVENPYRAEELVLPTVYDHFVSHQDSLGEAVMGWFQGERSLGVQEIENILVEGSTLTGVGELVVEGGQVKLRPPSSGFTFFLTSLPVETLIKKLDIDAKFFKTLAIILGFMGTVLLTYILKSVYETRKRKLALIRQKQQFEEARRQRRALDPCRGSRDGENTTVPLCVVCMTHPVEVVILECGHTCLCLDCSAHINRVCPVCRSSIQRIVPAYLP